MNEEAEIPEGTRGEEVLREKKRVRKKQLYSNIKSLMEFYFSEANLSRERWLSQRLSESNDVELSHFLGFNKVRALTNNVNDIVKALRNSELLEVTEDYKVRRTVPLQFKENPDDCIVYVEQIPPDADHDWLKNFFSCYGNIDYISIPKYANSKKCKGFAFIEFIDPESAQKAIDEYKNAGRYLSNNIEPEELLSISTFEKKSTTLNEPIDMETKEIEAKPEMRMHEKRKHYESPEHCDSVDAKRIKLEEKEEIQVDNAMEDHQIVTLPNNAEEELNPEECGGELEGNVDEMKRKKHRKKKKKTKKNKITPETTGFQILSKKDWKSLRNKYLNIQREKMKRLKQNLRQKQFHTNGNNKTDKKKLPKTNNEEEVNTGNDISKDFISGVIVKIEVSEPVVNLKHFKDEVKNKTEDVKYVDVKEGSFCAFIRLASSEAANDFCEKSVWNNAEVLKGNEEIEYWKKLEEDRQDKLSKASKKVKVRGKEKMLKKAEKLLGKHITFYDDDDNAV